MRDTESISDDEEVIDKRERNGSVGWSEKRSLKSSTTSRTPCA